MVESQSPKLSLQTMANIVCITINNPPANTWDLESLSELERVVHASELDPSVYCLVITGRGEKFFSAGAELALFADGNAEVARQMADHFGRAFEALAAFRGVSIAAINGYALGGGLECALACDIRIAQENAQLGLPETTVGLLPCGGGTQNLAWTVGESWAKRLILCGERLSAEHSMRIGLVEEVVERGDGLNRAMDIARSVAKQSPMAVAASKDLIRHARKGNLADAYSVEREAFVGLFGSRDQREGVNAFLQKREPKWTNS